VVSVVENIFITVDGRLKILDFGLVDRRPELNRRAAALALDQLDQADQPA
jgi:predicted unusual protein kinase regulating ubiquinone biosynthesis (AarF/ABC1/UbiB family)